MLDLLIRDAEIVDGTGVPARHGDVGVSNGRIVAVGDVDDTATKTVDAQGQTLAPGFVDLHTHYDAQLFWDPTASPSVQHGVTTVFGGNCGFTLAPAASDQQDYLTRMLARVEGMPLDALRAGLDWGWASFGDWLDRLDGRIAVNAGFLVGHSALRLAAMGSDAVGGEAGPEQIEKMVAVLHDALNAGALGLSTSQSPTHNDGSGQPVPSRSASRDELVALAAALHDHPGTTLEAIIAGCLSGFTDDDLALLTDMSVAADRPLNWKEAGMLRGLAQWDRLVIVETFAPENADATGRSIGEIAAARDGEPFDTLLDIVIADELRTGLSPPLTGDNAADWKARAEVWQHPGAVIGGSDAGAHLDMMCGAIYTTSLLGRGVREHQVVTLEEAVRLITDVPARFYGLTERGRITPGWHADLVMFDPATIDHGPERTRYDLPSGAPRLVADAHGITSVLVGGVEVCRDGAATGALPGAVLRSGRDTATVSAS